MPQYTGHAAPVADSSAHLDDRVFRTHFDNLPGPAFIWRREGDDFRLLAHNRAGATIGNRLMGPLVGSTASELYGDYPDILGDLLTCAATGRVLRREADYDVPGGEIRTFVATCVPLSPDTVVAHVEDVTEQRAALHAIADSEARERYRIGREIHDSLAQMLTGAKLLLELLEKRLREGDSLHASDARQAVELINGTIAQARELARGLSPLPEGTPLFAALELLASQSAKWLGVQCRASCRCVCSAAGNALGEAAVAHLYRIAQEAVTNAVRHGRATQIEVSCRIDDGDVTLEVADNGGGFVQPAARSDGLGLKIMRDRARALGGDIVIVRRPEGGTLLRCTCRPRVAARRSRH